MSLNGSAIVRSAKFLRHAGAIGPAVRERAAARLDEQRIDVAVITAFELDDLVATGESAREPQARHRRFRPAVDHPHFFDRRNPAADQFRHFHFERIGNSKTDTARRRVANRLDHDRGACPRIAGPQVPT